MKHMIIILIAVVLMNQGGFAQSWEVQYPLRTVHSLNDVAFVDELHGLAVGYGGQALITSDGGFHWNESPVGINFNIESVDYLDLDNMWIAGGGPRAFCYVLHSGNGGNSWEIQFTDTGYGMTSIDFVNSQDGWVVGAGGAIFHTTNGGATWLPQNSGVTELLRKVQFFNNTEGWVAGNHSVLHTTDGGLTWTSQQIPLISTDYWLKSLYFTDETYGWVTSEGYGAFGDWIGQTFQTTDGGVSWNEYGVTLSFAGQDVFFPDANNGWIVGYSMSWNGFYSYDIMHTTDAGMSWHALPAPPQQYHGIAFLNNQKGWIVGSVSGYLGFIISTTDGGENWTNQLESVVPLADVQFTDVNNGWVIGYGGTVLHTIDGGSNWLPQDIESYDQLMALDFLNNSEGWIVGMNGTIRHTTNGGTNWTTVPSPNDLETCWRDIDFVNANTGWIIKGINCDGLGGGFPQNIYLFHTTNGGLNWILQDSLLDLHQIEFLDANQGWAIGGTNGIFRTTNGGESWEQQNSGTGLNLSDISFVDAEYGWMIANNSGMGFLCKILATTDGGQTWNEQAEGWGEFNSIDFSDRNHGWVSGWAGTDPSINLFLKTDNGGNTWTSFQSNEIDHLMFLDSEHGWGVGYDGTIMRYDPNMSAPEERNIPHPSSYTLSAYPNPFNPTTNITYDLPQAGKISLRVFDVLGREVAVLHEGFSEAGNHNLTFDGSQLSSGIYFASLVAGKFSQIKKLILIK